MKILLIGGTGNISSQCRRVILDHGHDVYTMNRGINDNNYAKLISADVRNSIQVKNALRGKTFDVIVDFLCYNKDHAKFAKEEFIPKTGRYFFISSTAVYRRPCKLPIVEAHGKGISYWNSLPIIRGPIPWKDDYIIGKLQCEEILEQTKNVIIIRPSHTYDTIIPCPVGYKYWHCPNRILLNKAVPILGDGTSLWTLTHSFDFATALLGLIESGLSSGDYNVVGDEVLTWIEILDGIYLALGVKSKRTVCITTDELIQIHPKLGFEAASHRSWCDIYDNSKLKSVIPTWKPVVKYKDGIAKTIEWFLQSEERRKITNTDFDDNFDKWLEDKNTRIITQEILI